MKRIITGLTLINRIKELKRVPKLKDNINYFVEARKDKGSYEINYANLFEPVLLSPFIKEGLLLPFWIFEFIKKVFYTYLNEDEKQFVDMLLDISENLVETELTESLKIGNYKTDSIEFYKFKELVYKTILKYGKLINDDSVLRKLIIGLLSWKRDKEVLDIYNNLKDRVDVLYRPDWDYFLRAVYLFALSDQKDLEKMLNLYIRSEKKKTNFYKDSVPTFAFARMVNFEKHIKNKEVEVNFCRIGVYEDLKDINIFFPQKLLRNFELEESITLLIKQEAKTNKFTSKEIKNFLVEELDALSHIEGVLGFMGVYIDSYNDFRILINLPPIELKYYMISNDAIILKTTGNFLDILDYIEKNNQKIKSLFRDSGASRETFEGELKKALKNEKELFKISQELNSSPINILRKIQGSTSLSKLVYDTLEEEEEMEILPKDKNSFFYKAEISEDIIEEFIRIIINKHKKKEIKNKEIPYSLLKLAVKKLLDGGAYSSVISTLLYDHNFKVKEVYLKKEIEIYFGSEIIEKIKRMQLIKKRKQGKF